MILVEEPEPAIVTLPDLSSQSISTGGVPAGEHIQGRIPDCPVRIENGVSISRQLLRIKAEGFKVPVVSLEKGYTRAADVLVILGKNQVDPEKQKRNQESFHGKRDCGIKILLT